MAEPTYTLEIEFVSGSYTNVSSLCERAYYERNLVTIFDSITPAAALFQLANDPGSYSPLRNTNLLPGKRIRLQATFSGSSRNLYAGRVKDITTNPRLGERTTVINALTETDRVSRTLLNTTPFVAYNAASLFTEIMSRASVNSFAVLETLFDEVNFAWYQDRTVTGAVDQLVRSGNYLVYVDGAGTFNLKGRYFNIGASSVGTHDGTNQFDLNYALTDSRIINKVKVSSVPRKQETSVSTLAYLAQPISLPASGSVGFFISFLDPRDFTTSTPVGSIVTLVSSQDYYVAANSDGTGTNHTSTLSISMAVFAETAVASLFNGTGAETYLTRFQVRGYPILRGTELAASTEDSSSQNIYGLSESVVEDVLMTDYGYLRDLATVVLGERKNPRDDVMLALKNEWPQLLDYEVGQVLSLVDSISGVNSTWLIRSFTHEISLTDGTEHVGTYNLEYFAERPWLILDHATYGKLDSGRQLAL